MPVQKIDFFSIISLLMPIFVIFVLVYSPHIDYRFPLHNDEWNHLSKAVQIIGNQRLVDINPYFGNAYADTEPGFHILLSEIILVSGINPIEHFKFLPAIFAGVSSFLLFVLVYKKTDNFFIGILAMLFFATLKSNINLLGLWFFVPMSVSIGLTYLYLYALSRVIENRSNMFIVIGMFLFSALFLIHPISAVFVAFISVICSLFYWKNLISNIRPILYFSLIAVSALGVFFINLWKQWGDYLDDVIVDHVIYEYGWGSKEILYPLQNFYGTIAFALALLGIIIAFKNRQWLLVVWPLVTLGILSSYTALGLTIIAPYQRMLYLSICALVVVSALGLYHVLIKVYSICIRISTRDVFNKTLSSILISLILILVFFNSMRNYYGPHEDGYDFYQIISEADYTALSWLERNYGSDNLILASNWLSVTINPISGNQVVAFMHASLDGGDIDSIDSFFEGDCHKKLRILEEKNPDFIIARGKLNCPFLKEIYSDGTQIYIIE